MAKDDERLAAALRENLRRRKAQGRARAAQEVEPRADSVPADTAPGALPDRAAMD